MAHTPYTGKQFGATVTFNAIALAGWQKIVIKEEGAPVAESQDITVAASSGFAYQDNPLGGKGAAKTTVTVSGLLPRADSFGSNGITDFVKDTSASLIVRKGTGAGADTFTQTMYFKNLKDDHAHAGKYVSYEMTFEANGAGTWSASVS